MFEQFPEKAVDRPVDVDFADQIGPPLLVGKDDEAGEVEPTEGSEPNVRVALKVAGHLSASKASSSAQRAHPPCR